MKKSLVTVALAALVAVGSGVAAAKPADAAAVTLADLVRLFISVGIISPDKAAQAEQAVGITPGSIAVPGVVAAAPYSTTSPAIVSLSPATVVSGATVYVKGAGFVLVSNEVDISQLVNGVTVADATSTSFVPSTNAGQSLSFAAPTLPGGYYVSIHNVNGTSTTAAFTVLASGTSFSSVTTGRVVATVTGTPAIISMTPISGPTGTSVTMAGLNFSPNNNLLIDNATATTVPSYDGKTITFAVPSTLSPGPHTFAVQNAAATQVSQPVSNTKTFAVYSSSVNDVLTTPVLNTISPATATFMKVPPLVISGSGFTTSNYVYVDGSPIIVPSYDGTTLTLNLPDLRVGPHYFRTQDDVSGGITPPYSNVVSMTVQ